MFRYNAVQSKLITCKHIVVRIFEDGIDNVNVKTKSGRAFNRDFLGIYRHFFLNFSEHKTNVLNKMAYDDVGESGKMLIIAADDYYDSVIPLRDWRTRSGHQTTLVKCSDIGTTATAVKSYIQNMYNTQGVTYILFVGEGNEADIPSESVPYLGNSYEPKDPMYALLEGGPTEPYPDAYVSRISAENVSQVENQVTRIFKYETEPVSGSWFQQACGIASHEGNPADSTRCNLLRSRLLGYGYNSVDKLYDITSHQPITNAINAGRGVVNYIGHGTVDQWGFNSPRVWPLFSVSNVQSLTINNKLPFIFSVACDVGYFSYQNTTTCFAESWLRSGTEENPKGAIGFYGSSIGQPWIEPLAAQLEATDLLVADENITIGGLCFNGSCKMIEDYPHTGPSVFNTWHIFGDAATPVWTKTPMDFTSVNITDNGSSITVNTGIPGSTITVSSANNGLSYWNCSYGTSSHTFSTNERPLYITVTKHNYLPYTAITGGNITSNEYWFGNMKILGNLTIASGNTLTIEKDMNIEFSSGKYLYINGNLTANGATFTSTSGTWGGIRFQSGSGGTLSNCTITQAGYGIKCENSTPVIDNCNIFNSTYGMHFSSGANSTVNQCTIEDCSYGLYLSGASPVIDSCTVSDCSTYGLYVYNSSPDLNTNRISNSRVYLNNCGSVFSNNLITGQTQSGMNAILMYNSSPHFYYNTINIEDAIGIEVSGGNPVFGGEAAYGYNILDNDPEYDGVLWPRWEAVPLMPPIVIGGNIPLPHATGMSIPGRNLILYLSAAEAV